MLEEREKRKNMVLWNTISNSVFFKTKCELGQEGGLNGKEVRLERQAGVRACGQRHVILHEVSRSPISFYGFFFFLCHNAIL